MYASSDVNIVKAVFQWFADFQWFFYARKRTSAQNT